MRLRRFGTEQALGSVEFCERCGSVCDAGCRAEEQREQLRLEALRLVGRI